MKTTTALFIALALAATTPAFGRSHHHQQSGAAGQGAVNSTHAAPRDRNDVPFAPF